MDDARPEAPPQADDTRAYGHGRVQEAIYEQARVLQSLPHHRPGPGERVAERAVDVAGSGVRAVVERRGLRLTLIGLALIAAGLWLGIGSALSVPVLALGGVIFLLGVLGPRLAGRVVLDFGGVDGATFDLHVHIAPAERRFRKRGRLPTTGL